MNGSLKAPFGDEPPQTFGKKLKLKQPIKQQVIAVRNG
jgi:hypothetical protein